MIIKITQGDIYSTITTTITQSGVELDLSGAVAYFYMKHTTSGNVYREQCAIVGSTLLFNFTQTSSSESGIYKANFYITFPDGTSLSVPNDEYINVVIKPAITNLGAAANASALVYMTTNVYDMDNNGVVDLADKLSDGGNGKSYADINDELTSHALLPNAHHSSLNDPTINEKAALDAAISPSTSNRFVTNNDLTNYMLKTTYDTNNDGIVDTIDWSAIQSKPSTYPSSTHTHLSIDITNLQVTIAQLINSLLIAGTDITTAYDSNTGKTTISVAGLHDTTDVQEIIDDYVTVGTGITKEIVNGKIYLSYTGTPFVASDIKDIISATITSSNGITTNYNPTAKLLNIDYQITNATLKQIQEMIGTFLVAGTNVTTNYDNITGKITIGSTAVVADDVRSIITNTIKTGSNISAIYDSVNQIVRISYTGNEYTDSEISDLINTTITNTNGITKSYIGNTLTLGMDITTHQNDILDMVGGNVTAGTGISVSYNRTTHILTISITTHTHTISDITGLQSTLNNYISTSTLTNYLNKNTETLDNLSAGNMNVHFTSAEKTKLSGIAIGANVSPTDVFRKNTDTFDSIANGVTNVAYTASEKSKLAGIAASANNYTLPIATANALGGVKVGTGLSILNGVLSTTGSGLGDMLESEYVTGSSNTTHYVDTAKYLLNGASTVTYAGIVSAYGTAISSHNSDSNAHSGIPRYTNTMAVNAAKADSDIATTISNSHSHSNSTVLDGITDVGSGAIITSAERTKLSGIASEANNYSLPIAGASTLGGVKVGAGLSIDGDTGVLSATVTTAGNMYENEYVTGSTNTTNVVDTANALLNSGTVKTYANIVTDYGAAITAHAGVTTAHHTNANDPSATQKAALAGTNGTPSGSNKYVTDSDSRMTNSRSPTTHATNHSAGSTDPISIENLVYTAESTTGNVSTTIHGLVPIAPNDDTKYLDGTGAWTVPAANVTYGEGGGCAYDDSRLTNARTPTTHASSHSSGQSDAISIENLVFNTNTTNDTSTTKHGLCPALPAAGGTSKYLRGDGTWVDPSPVIVDTMTRWEEGVLSTGTSFMPHLVVGSQTISAVKGYIQVLPTGSSIYMDIRKNNPTLATNSVFTSDAPQEIGTAISSTNGVYQFDYTSNLDAGQTGLVAGDVLYLVINSVGSTSAGTGLYVKVMF